MTEQEIKDYFGLAIIYKWDGNLESLQQAQEAAHISYNVIRTGGVVYFSCVTAPVDSRATLWFDNTQGAV